MQIKFETSGVGISKGLLRARADLYIDDPASKTYAQQYVHVPVIGDNKYPGKVGELGTPIDPVAYQTWLNTLPHIWRLNPVLCHFFAVPENFTVDQVSEYLKEKVFTPDNVATMDNYLALPMRESAHYVSPFMRRLPRLTDTRVQTKDLADLILSTKTLLNGKVIDLADGGKVTDVEPQSIDIGSGATDRVSSVVNGYTLIDNGNTANADGTLDTFQIYPATNITGLHMGTFSYSGAVHNCRDAEADIGNADAGGVRTFTGLNCSVLTGDKLGFFSDTGTIDADSGGVGLYYYSGAVSNQCFAGSSQTYSSYGYTMSLYATGTESGGGSIVPIIMGQMNQFDGGSYL